MADTPLTPIEIGLTAAIVTVEDEEPAILVAGERSAGGKDTKHESPAGLPFGPFDPIAHRTFEIGLRAFVEAQAGLAVGYVEQLYTFGDRGRHAQAARYRPAHGLGRLSRADAHAGQYRAAARRRRRLRAVVPLLPVGGLARAASDHSRQDHYAAAQRLGERLRRPDPARAARTARASCGFASVPGKPWDEERVLDRYELLYEAGLIEEARRDGRPAALSRRHSPALGEPMRFDHRRILATAIARLRAKLKYRPVVFELMPREFTLTELQRTVEAISGRRLHKQNFRRLVETAALVEATGEMSTETGGRPAALFRFRRDVLAERQAGLRLGMRG